MKGKTRVSVFALPWKRISLKNDDETFLGENGTGYDAFIEQRIISLPVNI